MSSLLIESINKREAISHGYCRLTGMPLALCDDVVPYEGGYRDASLRVCKDDNHEARNKLLLTIAGLESDRDELQQQIDDVEYEIELMKGQLAKLN